jgi:two-component system LytT family sensor kinase
MKLLSVRGVVRAYLMSIAFWCGIALLMVLQYRPFSRQNPWVWLVDLVVEVALRGFAFALWTPPIFYLVGKNLSCSKNRVRSALLLGPGAVPFVLLQTSILWVLVPPYDTELQKFLPRSIHSWLDMIRGGFADQIFIYIAIVVAAHAYDYLKRLRRQERERYEYQQALAASELQALKMQLHPHFLFNTLHGIATLVDGEPKTARAMILKLSSLLRKSLDRDSSDLVPLGDELSFAMEYLDLEKMRFGSRLRIEWHVAPETLELLVPQMILQPLVENAIRYGVACAREGGWVAIATTQNDHGFEIQVNNNVGSGSSQGTGVGLRNAEARLKYLYGGEATLHFTMTADHIATARLTLPALNTANASSGRIQPHTAAEGKDLSCAFSSSMTSH